MHSDYSVRNPSNCSPQELTTKTLWINRVEFIDQYDSSCGARAFSKAEAEVLISYYNHAAVD